MLTAYFDASGSPNREVVTVVAGFLSTSEKWHQFDNCWKAVLSEFEVPYFHMRQYAHSRGIFSGWKGNEGRRRAFLRRLIGIIRKYAFCSFSSSFLYKEFVAVDKEYQLSEQHWSPYVICGGTAIKKVYTWMQETGCSRESVEFILEKGDEDQTRLRKWLEEQIGVTPIFLPKLANDGEHPQPTTPLQAADLVAWEHQKLVVEWDKAGAQAQELRKSLAELKKTPFDWGAYTRADLVKLCEKNGLPRRRITGA